MPLTVEFKSDKIVVNCDGPHTLPGNLETFTFEMVMVRSSLVDGEKLFETTKNYYRRDRFGWSFLDPETGRWFATDKRFVPQQVIASRIQYGAGDIAVQQRNRKMPPVRS